MFFACSAKLMNHREELMDINDLYPVILSPITGTSPRGINVISGTSADLYEIEPGKSYFMKATELEEGDKSWVPDASDKEGNLIRQFQYEMQFEMPMELVIAQAMAPTPKGEVKLNILIKKPEQGWLKAKVTTPELEVSDEVEVGQEEPTEAP